MIPVLSLGECKRLSLSPEKSCKGDLEADFIYNGENAYSVCIGDREFGVYTAKGNYTFVVDTYGDKSTFELFDWEKEE